MTCIQFEESFDRYVDGLLDKTEAAAARAHLACCTTCDRSVTRWQQTRILLSTAVAEVATAVDVSDLASHVHAALDPDRGSSVRPAAYDRAPSSRSGRSAGRVAAQRSARSGSAWWRVGAAASVSAAAAALFVVLMSPVKTPVRLAEAPEPIESTIALASSDYSPPAVDEKATDVDAIEAAPGHMVSTWVHPRSKARVIWVENRTPIENVDFGR
ncbi:MAG TPA: zf-HC2 domain-containing protein [Candidatus Limnocylindrales bacterium]|nr:zf-HC2 domain-containing protein [Candidatus Limnocylindrales bacterium]